MKTHKLMTGRERILLSLDHREPDRVPVDFGASAITGLHVSCVAALRQHFDLDNRPVKVHEPYQMLGWVDEDLNQAIGIDVEGVFPRKTMFGFPNENWKTWRLPDGLEVLVPDGFQTTIDENGDTSHLSGRRHDGARKRQDAQGRTLLRHNCSATTAR